MLFISQINITFIQHCFDELM